MSSATAVAVGAPAPPAVRLTKRTKPFRPARRLPAIRPTELLRYRDIRIACNLQCLHCSRVFRTPQGLGSHLSFIHGVHGGTAKYGVQWATTRKEAVLPRKEAKIARTRKEYRLS